MGGKGTLARYPDLVDLLVAAGRDPVGSIPVARAVAKLIRRTTGGAAHRAWVVAGQPTLTAATVTDFVR